MKKIFMTLLGVVIVNSVIACDVCGGAGGLQGIGYLPNSNFHFVGLSYKMKTFETEHPKLFETDPTVFGKNNYQSYELWGRYSVNERLQLFGFVPYHIKQNDDDQSYSQSGLGDISLLANVLIAKNDFHKWYLGSGVKLPTGKTNIATHNVVVPNLQLGTGSTDLLFSSNYTYLKSQFGFNNELNYTVSTKNNWDYKFGNQLDATALAFLKIQKTKSMLVPQLGLKYYHAVKDLASVKFNTIETYTGMSYVTLPVAFDYYKKQVGIRLRYEVPLFGEMSEGLVVPKANIRAQFIYIIAKNEDK